MSSQGNFGMKYKDEVSWCMQFAEDIIEVKETKEGPSKKSNNWRHKKVWFLKLAN